MKVVILSGGFGSRLSEYTKTIPKPLVTIGTNHHLHLMKFIQHMVSMILHLCWI